MQSLQAGDPKNQPNASPFLATINYSKNSFAIWQHRCHGQKFGGRSEILPLANGKTIKHLAKDTQRKYLSKTDKKRFWCLYFRARQGWWPN